MIVLSARLDRVEDRCARLERDARDSVLDGEVLVLLRRIAEGVERLQPR